MAAGFYDLLVVQGLWLGGKVAKIPGGTGGGSSIKHGKGGDGGKLVLGSRTHVGDDGYNFGDSVKYLDEDDEIVSIIMAELDDWF